MVGTTDTFPITTPNMIRVSVVIMFIALNINKMATR
jgi:hypothetical protein